VHLKPSLRRTAVADSLSSVDITGGGRDRTTRFVASMGSGILLETE